MLKKLGYGLFCAGALLSASALAANHQLAPGLSITYVLVPHQPEVFSNDWIWTITAKCTIRTPDQQDALVVKMLNNKGAIDGRQVSKGDQFSFNVVNGQKVEIVAEKGAKVQLTNLGASPISAVCGSN